MFVSGCVCLYQWHVVSVVLSVACNSVDDSCIYACDCTNGGTVANTPVTALGRIYPIGLGLVPSEFHGSLAE